MKIFGEFLILISKGWSRIQMYFLRPLFRQSGNNFMFSPRNSNFTFKNITVGKNVSIGYGASFIASDSEIIIGDNVIFGPIVTIVAGNHSSHIIGKLLCEYKLSDKRPEDDQPVIIEEDVWVGTGVIICNGVHVGRGSIIAAGAVVINNVPPYSVVGGVPARVLKFRWSVNEILEHERLLYPENKRFSQQDLNEMILK